MNEKPEIRKLSFHSVLIFDPYRLSLFLELACAHLLWNHRENLSQRNILRKVQRSNSLQLFFCPIRITVALGFGREPSMRVFQEKLPFLKRPFLKRRKLVLNLDCLPPFDDVSYYPPLKPYQAIGDCVDDQCTYWAYSATF